MTKLTLRRYFLSAGGLILLYFLWCLHPVVIGPVLVFPDSVPVEARGEVEARYPRPGFSRAALAHCFRHPFEGRDVVRFTHWEKPDGRHHSVHVPYGVAYDFVEAGSGWAFVRETRLLSVH